MRVQDDRLTIRPMVDQSFLVKDSSVDSRIGYLERNRPELLWKVNDDITENQSPMTVVKSLVL